MCVCVCVFVCTQAAKALKAVGFQSTKDLGRSQAVMAVSRVCACVYVYVFWSSPCALSRAAFI